MDKMEMAFYPKCTERKNKIAGLLCIKVQKSKLFNINYFKFNNLSLTRSYHFLWFNPFIKLLFADKSKLQGSLF